MACEIAWQARVWCSLCGNSEEVLVRGGSMFGPTPVSPPTLWRYISGWDGDIACGECATLVDHMSFMELLDLANKSKNERFFARYR